MPRTVQEIAQDMTEMQAWQGQTNVRMSKIDMILEQVIEQNKSFEASLKLFQETVNSHNVTMQRMQDRNDVTLKVISVVGGLLTTSFGVVLGQYVHIIHP